MARKNINILISTFLDSVGLSKATIGIEKLKGTVRKASAQMSSFFGGVGRNLMNIKAGIDLAISGFRTLASSISRGFEFERLTSQFKSLIGSIEDAKAHMKDLQDLGRTPPFNLEEFAAASRMMMKMSGGILGFKDDLKVVGDMAAATGNDITAVGRAFGLTYQVIRDGQDFGRAGQQLYMMGIMTKKQVAYFNDLIKSGRSNAEVWEEVRTVFDRYSGSMAEMEKTASGVANAIKGEVDAALTDLSTEILNEAKPALETILEALRDFISTGTANEWAEKIVDNFKSITESMVTLGKTTSWLWDHSGLSDLWNYSKGIVGGATGYVTRFAAGVYNGENIIAADRNATQTANEIATKHFANGYYTKGAAQSGWLGDWMKWAADDNASDEAHEAEKSEERKQKAAEKRIEKEKEDKERAAEHAAKVEEDLAKAIEEKELEEAAKERMRLENREDFEAEQLRKKWEEEEKRNAELNKEAEERAKVEHKAVLDFKRNELEQEKKAINEAHRIKMRLLSQEKAAYDEQIQKLKQMGAENPFRMAQTLDQAGNIRAERQAKIDEQRFEKARKSLEKKMRAKGIDPDGDLEYVSDLGRLSNLEQATLERMRLDRTKQKSDDVQQTMLDTEKEMRDKLEAIATKMESLGLN